MEVIFKMPGFLKWNKILSGFTLAILIMSNNLNFAYGEDIRRFYYSRFSFEVFDKASMYGFNRETRIVGGYQVFNSLSILLGTGIQIPIAYLYGYQINNESKINNILNSMFEEDNFFAAGKREADKYVVRGLSYTDDLHDGLSKEEFRKRFSEQGYNFLVFRMPLDGLEVDKVFVGNLSIWKDLEERKVEKMVQEGWRFRVMCACYEIDTVANDFVSYVRGVGVSRQEAKMDALINCPSGGNMDMITGSDRVYLSSCKYDMVPPSKSPN